MRLNWKWLSLLLLLVGLLHYGVLFFGFSSWAQANPQEDALEVMQARAITLPPPPAPTPPPPPPPKPKPVTSKPKAPPVPKVDTHSEASKSAQDDLATSSEDAAASSNEPAASEATPPPEPETPRPPVLANRAPSSSLLQYAVEATVNGLTYKGYGDLSWKSSETDYKAYLRFYLDFGIVETEFLRWMSEGQFDEYGLAPRRFAEKRIKKSERAAHFLPAENKISFSNNSPDAALTPGAQDRMSVIIQLVALAAGAPADLAPGKRFKLVSVGTSNASELSARVIGGESIDTAMGGVDTVKMVANASGKYEDDLEVWLAPQYQFLPVKLRIIRSNGDVAEMTLHKKPKAI